MSDVFVQTIFWSALSKTVSAFFSIPKTDVDPGMSLRGDLKADAPRVQAFMELIWRDFGLAADHAIIKDMKKLQDVLNMLVERV